MIMASTRRVLLPFAAGLAIAVVATAALTAAAMSFMGSAGDDAPIAVIVVRGAVKRGPP